MKLFQIIDYDQVNEYESVRKDDYVGFADYYLSQFINKFKSDDKIDKQIYAKLVKIDRSLGTTTSEQLFHCLRKTTRPDIIKVLIYEIIHNLSKSLRIRYD